MYALAAIPYLPGLEFIFTEDLHHSQTNSDVNLLQASDINNRNLNRLFPKHSISDASKDHKL